MPATLALIAQILALVPTLVSAGISIAGLVGNIRNALTEVGAPDDTTWQQLDAQCTALEQQFQKDAAAPTAA
jgi:hypothetical protein